MTGTNFETVRRCGLVAIILLQMACGIGMSPEKRIERAESAMQERDFQAASLDLKRALQDQPDNAQARMLLGQAFLGLGDAASAESELRRARSLGAAPAEINASIATALWLQRNYDELMIEPLLVDDLSDEDRTTIRVLRGNSNLATNFAAGARREFEEALTINPANTSALLGLVSTFVQQGDLDEARRRLDELRDSQPESSGVWKASATLHLAGPNPDLALAEADLWRATELALEAGNKRARLEAMGALVGVLLQSGKTKQAGEQIAVYRELSPDDIVGGVLDAQVHLARGEVEEAITILQVVLRRQPTLSLANVLMGIAQASNGNLGQAESYLSAAVQADPTNAMARTTLARVRGQLRQSSSAVAALEPLLALDDATALELAAQLSIAAGDLDGGLDYLRRRFEADPSNATLRLDYAAALMSARRPDDARQVLAGLDDSASGDEAVRGAIISILNTLADGDSSAAIAEAEKMVARYPDQALLRNLVGRVYAVDGSTDKARASFRKAIRLAPEDFAGYANLASVEFDVGRIDAARQVFRDAAEVVSDKSSALYGLAQIEVRMGNVDAAVTLLEDVIEVAPEQVGARMMLGRLLAQRNELAASGDQFEAVVGLAPNNAAAHYFLGLIARASGDDEKALASLEKAAALQPQNWQIVLNLSRAYASMDRDAASREALQSGYDAGVRHPSVVASLAALHAADGDLSDALALADTIETEQQQASMIYLVRGNLYVQAERYQAAAAEYAAAYDETPDWRVAARQMVAMHRAGEPNPQATLAEFVANHPDNLQAGQALAQLSQQQGNDTVAMAQYEALIERHPDNFEALNNLAWMYAERGDPRGVTLAGKANEIAPDSPEVVDTLGWAMLRSGDARGGLKELQRAAALDPDNPEIRYHVAVALVEVGDRAGARAALTELLQADRGFASREAAQTLLLEL